MGNDIFSNKINTQLGNINVNKKTINIDLDKWQIDDRKQKFKFTTIKKDKYHTTWKYNGSDYVILCHFERLSRYKVYYKDSGLFGTTTESFNGPRLKISINIKTSNRNYGTYSCKSYTEFYNDSIFSK